MSLLKIRNRTQNVSVPVVPAINVLKDATKELIYIFLSFVKDTQSLLDVLREGRVQYVVE